jgi:uncharacterized Zn finger protein
MTELGIFADLIEGPQCGACAATTRVIGFEQHAVMPQLTVMTVECIDCGTISATIAMPPPAEHGACHAR